MFNDLELTGRAATHVERHPDLGVALHHDVVPAFLALKQAAAVDGIDLCIVSGFRDFGSQARIWNEKFRGERPLYDDTGAPLDHRGLNAEQRIFAILRWSALPGASRHHWGSDMDVIDRAAMPQDYRPRLSPREYAQGGVFHYLHQWLRLNLNSHGFFRPYASDRGGIHPEPWHLSHAVVSNAALALVNEELLRSALEAEVIEGREQVRTCLRRIYRDYVLNVAAPGPESSDEAMA